MATRQLSRRMSHLPYRIRRPARLLQERKSLSANEVSRPGTLGDGEALEADAPMLCGKQARNGRPGRPKLLMGRVRPDLGAGRPEAWFWCWQNPEAGEPAFSDTGGFAQLRPTGAHLARE